MTRKDYVKFANELGDRLACLRDDVAGEYHGENAEGIFMDAVYGVETVLAEDNPSFRREQFREAIEYRATTGKLVKVGQRNF